MKRLLAPVAVFALLLFASPSEAQSLGTFQWRLEPFCSVLNITVLQYGGVYSLVGYEEQCGGNPRLPVYGTAMLQADGTIWMGLTTIFPFGHGLHTQATLFPSLSGVWRDNGNQSGNLVFNPGPGPFLGGPRIDPIVPDPAISGATVESLAAELAALRQQVADLAARKE